MGAMLSSSADKSCRETSWHKRRLARAAIAAALCLAAAPAVAKRAPPPVEFGAFAAPATSLEGNFLAGYVAVEARDTTAAALFYRQALSEDPRNPELRQRAFVSLLADGDLNSAARVADYLIKSDPGNGLARLALGVRQLKAGHYVTARNLLSGGGRGRVADVTATLLSAWAYAGSRSAARALQAVDSLQGERGFAVFRDYHAGLIAELVGNDAEAERRLKAAYDAEKTTLRIVDAYARFLSRHGKVDAALDAYRAFDAVSPRHPFVKNAMGELQAGHKLPYLIATAQQGAAEVLYGLGSAGNQQGDEMASIVYLQLALQLDPQHALALVTLADVYERLHSTEQALDTLNRIPATSPLRGSADVQMALSLEQLGRGDEAVQKLEKLVKDHPDDTDALVALGNIYRSRKQYTESADMYGRAIERRKEGDPTRWTLYYYRGTSYERAKDWTKAEADLEKALSLVPDSQPLGKSQVLNYLGYSWVDQNTNIDKAFKMLRQAVDLNPRDGMIIDSLGWAYYRLGRYDDAVRELEKAIELKPADPTINDHLGDAYWRVGRKLEARFQWQHSKDDKPDPDDLKAVDAKLANGLPEEAKPAEAQSTAPDVPKSGG